MKVELTKFEVEELLAALVFVENWTEGPRAAAIARTVAPKLEAALGRSLAEEPDQIVEAPEPLRFNR